MNNAENRIAEPEKRITELEEKLENVMIYSEGANVSFNNSNVNMLQILGDGANIALENVPLYSVEISGDGNNVAFRLPYRHLRKWKRRRP